jgi:hypothetical protein
VISHADISVGYSNTLRSKRDKTKKDQYPILIACRKKWEIFSAWGREMPPDFPRAGSTQRKMPGFRNPMRLR